MMIDIQTYRVRIGGAPAMMSKILQRKLNNFVMRESMIYHHDDEELLKKTLKNLKVTQLHYLFFMLLTLTVTVIKLLALQNEFSTLSVKYIVSFFSDTLMDNLSAAFQTTAVLLNLIGRQTVQYIYEWTPVYEGADAFLWEGTLTVICTALCLHSIGAVHFIAILLLIAGIESNPGPNVRQISSLDLNVRHTIDEHNEESKTNGSPEVSNSVHVYPDRSEELNIDKFFTKQDEYRKLDLRNTTLNKEMLTKIISHIEKDSVHINEIDLRGFTYRSKPWFEHPECYFFVRRLIGYLNVHAKLRILEKSTLTLDSALGYSLDIENKLLTKSDFRQLSKILTDINMIFGITHVTLRGSKFCEQPWGECPKYLDRLLGLPALQLVSVFILSNIGLTCIPHSFGTIHHQGMRKLDISNNNIKCINGNFLVQNVIELDISGNLLTTLPDEFNIPGLQVLNLEQNPMFEIPHLLTHLPNLKRLTIGSPETRTINRKLLAHAKMRDITIDTKCNPDALRAPSQLQLKSVKDLNQYLIHFETQAKELQGTNTQSLNNYLCKLMS